MSERLCRHSSCGCDLPPERSYCDPRCEEADTKDAHGDDCPCGHSACRPENARAQDPNGEGPIEPADVRNE